MKVVSCIDCEHWDGKLKYCKYYKVSLPPVWHNMICPHFDPKEELE